MTINKADKHYVKAYTYFHANPTVALEELEYATQSDPEHAQSFYLLGRIYLEVIGDFRQSEVYFQDAIKFDPYFVESYEYYVLNLIYLSKLKEASELINKSLRITGVDRAMLYKHSSKIYELNKDFDQAIKQLKKAIGHSLSTKFVELCCDDIDRINGKIKLLKLTGDEFETEATEAEQIEALGDQRKE